MYPHLDFAKASNRTTNLKVDETLIAAVFQNSKGERTMPDKDVKLALLSLYSTCITQQALIDELVSCVNELRTPKRRIFRR